MPKGKTTREAPPPEIARCDFCGVPFPPHRWNSRTCVRCRVKGAPCQADAPDYAGSLDVYLRARNLGNRRPKRIKP